MHRHLLKRLLLSAAFILCGWSSTGVVLAQPSTLRCYSIPSPVVINPPGEIHVNRATPIGTKIPGAVFITPSGTFQCHGGAVGMPLEIAVRMTGTNPRANPLGDGTLMDSRVPGLGLVVISNLHGSLPTNGSDYKVIYTGNRVPPHIVQTVSSLVIEMYAVKTGAMDHRVSDRLENESLVTVYWRSPGSLFDAWQELTEFRVGPGETRNNVERETCHFSAMDDDSSFTRTHNLGTLAPSVFTGVGSEGPRVGAPMLTLTCRNFSGGTLQLASDTLHPTVPGVVGNALTGAQAATGVGVRIYADENRLSFTSPWRIPPGTYNTFNYIHYGAGFVQTAPTVGGGKFAATVTITVLYN